MPISAIVCKYDYFLSGNLLTSTPIDLKGEEIDNIFSYGHYSNIR